jgi:ribosome-associated protein
VDDLKPSKSARKREYIALQKLGEELITLKVSDLDSLPLDDNLREAVLEARQMKAHGALRRQKQYIGKLMRHIDPEPIRSEMAKLRR